MDRKIVIGSRGSDLALWQANYAKQQLEGQGIQVGIKIIKTKGDKEQDLSFDKMEGKGFFTKELEDALLNKDIDLAVHSHKDLPTASPAGLVIAGVSSREDPSELLIIRRDSVDIFQKFNLKEKAKVGTSSPRRMVQFRSFRPDVNFDVLRGNVPTRLDKLRKGQYDAIILAYAGVNRLKLDLEEEFHVEKFSPHVFIPAPAQGVLAYQVRENDDALKSLIQKINDVNAAQTVSVEREILRLFEGGCQVPLGAYARREKDKLLLWLAKAEDENSTPVRNFLRLEPEELNAAEIVDKLKNNQPKSIFISRTLEEDSILKSVLTAHNYQITDRSLVAFQAINFSTVPEVDWIFFSSKNAVKYFFERKPQLPSSAKFGAIGTGTAAKLREYGVDADFVGANMETNKIAGKFAALADYQSVLFPQAKNSLRTVQRNLPGTVKIFDLIVYDNKARKTVKKQTADLLIFTSPLSAEAYLSKHTVEDGQKVMAIGNTTADKIRSMGVAKVYIPYSPDELSILDMTMSL